MDAVDAQRSNLLHTILAITEYVVSNTRRVPAEQSLCAMEEAARIHRPNHCKVLVLFEFQTYWHGYVKYSPFLLLAYPKTGLQQQT